MPRADGIEARYPAGAIDSVEAADRALEEVGQERKHIGERFSAEERDCHAKFFVNSCIDEARERRRKALAGLRPIELEANAFKRHARVVERDQELAERRLKNQAPQEPASDRKARAPVSRPQPAGAAAPNPEFQRQRQPLKPEPRVVRTPEQEQAEARQRAENVAAYERKVRAAEAHQRAVEARKLEKERKRAAKAGLPQQ